MLFDKINVSNPKINTSPPLEQHGDPEVRAVPFVEVLEE
jgi:hypothetical protein